MPTYIITNKNDANTMQLNTMNSNNQLRKFMNYNTNNNNLRKNQLNLPSKLINIQNLKSFSDNNNILDLPDTHLDINPNETILNSMDVKNLNNNIKTKNKSKSEFKSVSSSFSSITRDGDTQSSGKTIINNSNKPYLQVEETKNGSSQQYIIPKQTIDYTAPSLIYNDNNNNIKKPNIKKPNTKTPSKAKKPKSKTKSKTSSKAKKPKSKTKSKTKPKTSSKAKSKSKTKSKTSSKAKKNKTSRT